MNPNDKLDEICISYDFKSRSVAFYNVATKNRIRYSNQNFHNIAGALKHIDSIKPLIHWPRYCHPLRVFINNVRYLNNQSGPISEKQKESDICKFWDSLWNQMQAYV